VDTVAGGYWLQQRIWLRIDICNIRSESDSLSSLVFAATNVLGGCRFKSCVTSYIIVLLETCKVVGDLSCMQKNCWLHLSVLFGFYVLGVCYLVSKFQLSAL
jgi:hypothetical protein